MIREDMMYRRSGSHEMVVVGVGFVIETREALCYLALYLARGWKIRVWQKFQPHCDSLIEIVLEEEEFERRVRFSTSEFDLRAFHEMAECAHRAGTEEGRLTGIKRELLRGCGFEEPSDESLALSIENLVGAIIYYHAHLNGINPVQDLMEANSRRVAQSSGLGY